MKLGLYVLVVCALGCGGRIVVGEENGPEANPGDASLDGRPSDGGPLVPPDATNPGDGGPTLAVEGFQPLPWDTQNGRCNYVAGMSASDLWCLQQDKPRAFHWDGSSWTEIPIPPPTNDGVLQEDAWHKLGQKVAVAGPGALWLATTYGLARLNASSASEDRTSSLPGGLNGASYPLVSQMGTNVLVARTVEVFALGGNGFSLLPSAPLDGSEVTSLWAQPDGVVWVVGSDAADSANVLRFDGSAWKSATTTAGISSGSGVVPLASDFWNVFLDTERPVSYCPAWCHPDTPPFNETLSSDWRLQHVSSSGGALTAASVTVGVPADIPRDGSVSYEGRGLLPSGNQIALMGCLTARSSPTVGRWIAHLSSGQAPGPMRQLPEAAGNCQQPGSWDRPLVDGTWVFHTGNELVSDRLVLVRP
jgi:hypothetical protein